MLAQKCNVQQDIYTKNIKEAAWLNWFFFIIYRHDIRHHVKLWKLCTKHNAPYLQEVGKKCKKCIKNLFWLDACTWADKIAAKALSEIMKHAVAMLLVHFGMYVVAGVTKFCDFLSKQLNTLCRVAKYNRLVYLQ